MKIVNLQVGSDRPEDYFLFTKYDLAALISVSDKNPRSQFLYMSAEAETAWVIASNRAIRLSASNRAPLSWQRVSIKDIKNMKVLQTDALLIRHRSLDVAQLHKVSFLKKNWSIESGADMVPNKECETSVQSIESKVVSAPPLGSSDYSLAVVEDFFASNTGGSVSCVDLGMEFMETIPKIAAAVGKKERLRVSPGKANVPVVFIAEQGDLTWRYALLEQSAPFVPKPIPRPAEDLLDQKY